MRLWDTVSGGHVATYTMATSFPSAIDCSADRCVIDDNDFIVTVLVSFVGLEMAHLKFCVQLIRLVS